MIGPIGGIVTINARTEKRPFPGHQAHDIHVALSRSKAAIIKTWAMIVEADHIVPLDPPRRLTGTGRDILPLAIPSQRAYGLALVPEMPTGRIRAMIDG